MNRTCPEVVCAIIYLHWGEPFLKHLEFKTCGWQNDRHSENFHCRVWARIKILVSSYKSDDHMSPLEGQVHHIDCMFIHFLMHAPEWKVGPLRVCNTQFWAKTWEIKNVLVVALIFKKSCSLWTKAWLASSLLEQKLIPSNWPIIFVQTPTTTQPQRNWGANMIKSLNTIRRGIAP